jgi:hypothetical protein
MFMWAFNVVVEATLAERWMLSRWYKHFFLRVAKDSKVYVVAGGHSIEDVVIPFFVYDCNELRGRLLAGMTVVVNNFNVVAALDEF